MTEATRSRGRWIALAALSFAVCLGAARLLQQRAHPPDWAVGEHLFDGFLAIDGHAHRAQAFRDWLTGNDPGAHALHAFFARDNHTTTVAVPLLTAVVSLVGLSIPWSYFAVVVLLFLGSVHLAGRLAAELADGPPSRAAPGLVAIYLALHVTTARTLGQLELDQGLGFAAAGAALAGLRWARTGNPAQLAVATGFLLFGVFTKSSALPLAALPPLLALAADRPLASRLRAVVLAVLPGLVAFALAWAWSWGVAGAGPFERDSAQQMATRLRPGEFAVEVLLLAQAAPVLMWWARPWPRAGRWLAAGAVVVFASVAVFRLPSTARLYVPTLVLGVPLFVGCAPRLAADRRVLAAFVCVDLALATALFARG